MSKSEKKNIKSSTFAAKNSPFSFTEFQKEEENHTYYDDQMDLEQRPSNGCFNSFEKNGLEKEIGTIDYRKADTSKSETQTHMQDEYSKKYNSTEKKFLTILSNTKMVYDYQLLEEYLLEILKKNKLGEYIDEYIQLLESNGVNYHRCIIDLGESSIQRFIQNHEKRILEFPPQETDEVMIIRNGE